MERYPLSPDFSFDKADKEYSEEVRRNGMNENDESHKKKMIAPIIITVLLVAYYIFYFCILVALMKSMSVIIVLFGIVPIAMAGAMIYVCRQRIDEIRSGEEDDLGKY